MEGDIEVEVCDCGCGLNFIPDTPGFRLGLLDYERQLLYSFKEWEISNDTWANFIHDPWVFGKNDVIVQRWGEFQSLIIQSHFEKSKPRPLQLQRLHSTFLTTAEGIVQAIHFF